jgi:hypothetical protein
MVQASGKLMPVNAEPDPSGNVVGLGSYDRDGAEYVRVLKKADSRNITETLYRSHFASCTDPARHRHPRGTR